MKALQLDEETRALLKKIVEGYAYRQLTLANIRGHALTFVFDLEEKIALADALRAGLEELRAVRSLYRELRQEGVIPAIRAKMERIPYPSSRVELAICLRLWTLAHEVAAGAYEDSICDELAQIARGHSQFVVPSDDALVNDYCSDPNLRPQGQAYFDAWLSTTLVALGRPGSRGDRRAVELKLRQRSITTITEEFSAPLAAGPRELEPGVAERRKARHRAPALVRDSFLTSPDSPMTAPLDPHRWRAHFPILAETTYLVNHSLGAMPEGVRAKLAAYADQWSTRGVRAWAEGWWDAAIEVGDVVGKIMNAPPRTVCMHQNVSVIQSVVGSALDFSGRRNKVVYTDQNFPTNMYVWEGFRERGARIECVASEPDGTVPLERLLAAIDDETLIVPVSHVCFRTSFLQDARAICARAREVGALVLLDTYQSLGTVPIDVQELGVDMLCGGSVKWLNGGPGAAYLYVRPDRIEQLEPRCTGWAAHARPFAFELGAQQHAPGVERFQHGTPAVVALYAATAGYELVHEVGVDAIRAWSQHLTESLRERLIEYGFTSKSPVDPHRRGGSLTVSLRDDEDGPAFVAALEARGVLVDHRPEAGIRVSPHYYTTEDELMAFAEHLKELRDTKAWQSATASTSY